MYVHTHDVHTYAHRRIDEPYEPHTDRMTAPRAARSGVRRAASRRRRQAAPGADRGERMWVAGNERGKSSSASVASASASASAASVVGTPGRSRVILIAARFNRFHGPSRNVLEHKRTHVHTATYSADCRSRFLSIPFISPFLSVSRFLFLLSLVSFSISFIVSRLLS